MMPIQGIVCCCASVTTKTAGFGSSGVHVELYIVCRFLFAFRKVERRCTKAPVEVPHRCVTVLKDLFSSIDHSGQLQCAASKCHCIGLGVLL